MKTRLFSREEIKKYFDKNEIPHDLISHESIGISSIADFLELCETYKKSNIGNFIIPNELFYKQVVEPGLVFVAEVNQDTLKIGRAHV